MPDFLFFFLCHVCACARVCGTYDVRATARVHIHVCVYACVRVRVRVRGSGSVYIYGRKNAGFSLSNDPHQHQRSLCVAKEP